MSEVPKPRSEDPLRSQEPSIVIRLVFQSASDDSSGLFLIISSIPSLNDLSVAHAFWNLHPDHCEQTFPSANRGVVPRSILSSLVAAQITSSLNSSISFFVR